MNNIFKTLLAGYGAKKLGGGCFSTILIFILIYWLLGQCNPQSIGRTKHDNTNPVRIEKQSVLREHLK